MRCARNRFRAGGQQIFLDRAVTQLRRPHARRGVSHPARLGRRLAADQPRHHPDRRAAFLAAQRGADASSDVELAILLDYYFMHVLALLTMRIWDDGDPDENLERLNAHARGAAGTERQRPAVCRRRRDADADRHVALRAGRVGLRQAAGEGAHARRAPPVHDRPRPRRRAWAATCASASKRSAAATRWRCATTTSPTIRGCVLRWRR